MVYANGTVKRGVFIESCAGHSGVFIVADIESVRFKRSVYVGNRVVADGYVAVSKVITVLNTRS